FREDSFERVLSTHGTTGPLTAGAAVSIPATPPSRDQAQIPGLSPGPDQEPDPPPHLRIGGDLGNRPGLQAPGIQLRGGHDEHGRYPDDERAFVRSAERQDYHGDEHGEAHGSGDLLDAPAENNPTESRMRAELLIGRRRGC